MPVKSSEEIAATFAQLPPQLLLEECCKAAIYLGEYDAIRPRECVSTLILDGMNYSKNLFADPLPIRDLLSCIATEPGYGTVTGELEVGNAVRLLELSRAEKAAKLYGLKFTEATQKCINGATVVSTAGATGAVDILLRASVKRRDSERNASRCRIVYNAPCYPLAEAHARYLGLEAVPVVGSAECGFLATPELIKARCDERTLVCLLTLPTNPTQVSWGRPHVGEFAALIARCQQLNILLVVDTIFQDLAWHLPQPEVFLLASSNTNICKIFSPSKDRPLASGYRIGYLIGDPILRPWLENEKLLSSNSTGTIEQVWLAFDLIFRRAVLEGKLEEADFDVLKDSFCLGYGAGGIDPSHTFQAVMEGRLYDNYQIRVSQFMTELDRSLSYLHGWLDASECFEIGERPDYGNSLVVTVASKYQTTNAFNYFADLLCNSRVAASIGECFEFPADDRIRFRVVHAGNSVTNTILGMQRIMSFLKAGRRS